MIIQDNRLVQQIGMVYRKRITENLPEWIKSVLQTQHL
jgi:hypothetical protein